MPVLVAVSAICVWGGGRWQRGSLVPVQIYAQSARETACQTEDNFRGQESAVCPDGLGRGGKKKLGEGRKEARGLSRQLKRLAQLSNRFDLQDKIAGF